MMRLILSEVNSEAAAFGAGPSVVTHRTFDVDLPAVEAWLLENVGTYRIRTFVGIEVDPRAIGAGWEKG